MKVNGKRVEGINYEYIVIPRHDGDVVFKAQAIVSMDEFRKLCPEPAAPKVMIPGGEKQEDVNDAAYKIAMARFGEQRYAYMVVKSLEATPGLEWDTVKLTDPDTWLNWADDMRGSGFTTGEINLVQLGVATANSLNQEKLDEARDRFLRSLLAAESRPA